MSILPELCPSAEARKCARSSALWWLPFLDRSTYGQRCTNTAFDVSCFSNRVCSVPFQVHVLSIFAKYMSYLCYACYHLNGILRTMSYCMALKQPDSIPLLHLRADLSRTYSLSKRLCTLSFNTVDLFDIAELAETSIKAYIP